MSPAWILLLQLVAAPPAESAEQRGDAAWALRGRGFSETGKVDPAPAELAVAAYEQALADDPDKLDLRFKLSEALYFHGHFATVDRTQQKRDFERMVELAEETVDLVASRVGDPQAVRGLDVEHCAAILAQTPGAVPAHFWAAVAWGVWGMSHSHAAAATHGVAGKIRDHARLVARLDPAYRDGGGFRLLGRLHTVAPKFPFVTGWIDRREGIALLEQAFAISSRDARNPLFLAEALLRHDPTNRKRALDLLREAAARVPDPQRVVEETETIEAAKRSFAEATKS